MSSVGPSSLWVRAGKGKNTEELRAALVCPPTEFMRRVPPHQVVAAPRVRKATCCEKAMNALDRVSPESSLLMEQSFWPLVPWALGFRP